MSELGKEPTRGVVVGTGKHLDEAGQRLVTLLASLLTSRGLQESKAWLGEAQPVTHISYRVSNPDTDQRDLVGRNPTASSG
jgi:hypothetical protein